MLFGWKPWLIKISGQKSEVLEDGLQIVSIPKRKVRVQALGTVVYFSVLLGERRQEMEVEIEPPTVPAAIEILIQSLPIRAASHIHLLTGGHSKNRVDSEANLAFLETSRERPVYVEIYYEVWFDVREPPLPMQFLPSFKVGDAIRDLQKQGFAVREIQDGARAKLSPDRLLRDFAGMLLHVNRRNSVLFDRNGRNDKLLNGSVAPRTIDDLKAAVRGDFLFVSDDRGLSGGELCEKFGRIFVVRMEDKIDVRVFAEGLGVFSKAVEPMYTFGLVVHEMVAKWPVLAGRSWLIMAGDIPLPDNAFVCSVCYEPHAPPLTLARAKLRFKVDVLKREIPLEMDRRLRIADLMELLKKRFAFDHEKAVIRFGNVTLGDYWQLGSILGLEQLKLVLDVKAARIVLRFQNVSGAEKSFMDFAIDDRVAAVVDRWSIPGGNYRFFRDSEKRHELFRDRMTWLVDIDIGDNPIVVEFLPGDTGRSINIQLTLPQHDTTHAITIDLDAPVLDLIHRTHDLFLRDGYYGLSLEQEGELLPPSSPLSGLSGHAQTVTFFAFFSATQLDNTVLLEGKEPVGQTSSSVKAPLLQSSEGTQRRPPPGIKDMDTVSNETHSESIGKVEITGKQLAAQPDDNSLVNDSPDIVHSPQTEPTLPTRKPLDYAAKWKRLVEETGKPPRLCRECLNRFNYIYDDALAELKTVGI
jgi:hypothetical protein